MKILIIGANGFIGKHLRQYLGKNEFYTLLTPDSKSLDITDEKAVDTYMQMHAPDVVNRHERRATRQRLPVKLFQVKGYQARLPIVEVEATAEMRISFIKTCGCFLTS